MARYIDADALEAWVRLNYSPHQSIASIDLMQRLKTMSTAYDVEAVVAELEEMFGVDPMYYGAEARWAVDKAISIVRGKE